MSNTTEKKICDDCAYNLVRNIPYSLDTYLCASCAKKFKVLSVIPATYDRYAKRDLADRVLALVRAADRRVS